jgi:hypothetical protein
MATKQPVYCKKTSSTVSRRNHKGVINVRRCSRTENKDENSTDCVYDNRHCGLVSRIQNRKMSKSNNTARKHKLSKMHVPSNCSTLYAQTQNCDKPCKLVSAYKSKNGKLRKASCRQTNRKIQEGGFTKEEIKQKYDLIHEKLKPVFFGPDLLSSQSVQNAIKLIQTESGIKVDPRNEMRVLDLNNDGKVSLDDLLLLASFKLSDQDNSGALSYDEVNIGLETIMGPAFKRVTRKEFDSADLSGNGTLDFSEYQILYVFKTNVDEEGIFVSRAGLKRALDELGVNNVSDQDIIDADISSDNKIQFSEFLLLCAFKWADMDVDKANQNNRLDDKETAMALRLLGMELKPGEFDEADSEKKGLDFSTFTSLAAYKLVSKDNKPLDRQKLENAIDYLGIGELAQTKRALNTEKRAEEEKQKLKSSEEEAKAKLEEEKNKARLAELAEQGKTMFADAGQKAIEEKKKNALEVHLKGLKLCSNGQKNPDGTKDTDKQVCLEQDQIDSRLIKITEKCDGSTKVNPPDMNDYPLKQVCQQGGRGIMTLRQFVKLIQSLRNNQKKMYY